MGLTFHPLTGSNTYCLFFKSTPRRPRRRHGRAGALARDAAAGHLRGIEMLGLQPLVQRLARKRLARDRDDCVTVRIKSIYFSTATVKNAVWSSFVNVVKF